MLDSSEIIKDYKIGGFNVDYAIKDKIDVKPKILIDLNINDSFDQENVSYKSIIYRKNMFNSMGYEYYLLNAIDYI